MGQLVTLERIEVRKKKSFPVTFSFHLFKFKKEILKKKKHTHIESNKKEIFRWAARRVRERKMKMSVSKRKKERNIVQVRSRKCLYGNGLKIKLFSNKQKISKIPMPFSEFFFFLPSFTCFFLCALYIRTAIILICKREKEKKRGKSTHEKKFSKKTEKNLHKNLF